MSDKQLRIGVSINDADMQKVLRSLRELNTEATKLANVFKNLTMPGGGGNGMFGGGSVTKGSRAPSGQQVQTVNKKFDITSGILDNAKAFKDMGKAGKEATEIMTSSVRRGISEQKSKIEELDRSIKKISDSYQRWKQIAKDAPDAKTRDMAQGHLRNLEEQGVGSAADRSKAASDLEKLENIAKPGPGIAQQMKGLAGALPFGIGGMLTNPGTYATAAAAYGVRQAGMSFNSYYLNREATIAQGAAATGLRYAQVRNEFNSGESARGMLGSLNMSQDERNYSSSLNGRGTRLWEGLKAVVSGDVSLGGITTDEMTNEVNKRVHDRQKKYHETLSDSSPYVSSQFADIQANARGRLNMQRALGLGGTLNPVHGASVDPITKLKNAYHGLYDEGDFGRAVGAYSSQGSDLRGIYRSKGALSSVLAGQAAQIGGIGELAGIASKFNGSQGGPVADAIRVLAARSGTGTASVLGGAVGSIMNAAGTENMGANNILGSLMSGVGSGPGSRLIAEQNVRGFQAMGGLSTGSIDPYQKARNLQIAMQSGAGNVYSQDYLANMDYGQMANVVNGGRMSGIAKVMGLTPDMVKSQFGGITNSVMERFISDPNMAQTTMGKHMAGIQASGGDMKAYFNSLKKPSDKNDALESIAALLKESGFASDEATAEGMARQIVGEKGAATTKGKKAAGAGGGSAEVKQLGIEAGESAKSLQELDAAADKLRLSFEAWQVQLDVTREQKGKFEAADEATLNEAKANWKKGQDLKAAYNTLKARKEIFKGAAYSNGHQNWYLTADGRKILPGEK